MTFEALTDSEKCLVNLKEEIVKAQAAKEAPEYKKLQQAFEIRYQDALREEDETGYHSPILEAFSSEDEYIDDLRREISDLENKLGYSPF